MGYNYRYTIKSMKNVKIKGIILLVCTVLFSLSMSSQVSRKQVTKTKTQTTNSRQSSTNLVVANTTTPFWTEDFGVADQKNGNHGIEVAKVTTSNGPWTITKSDPIGQRCNNWYVSAMEGGVGVGNCSMGFDKDNNILNNTLHVGYDYRYNTAKTIDQGAIYAKNESSATDIRVETPRIDCGGKSNITLNFNYFTGGIAGQDFASLYYFDGENWSLITTFGPSVSDTTCTNNDQSTWRISDNYLLPSSADNNPGIKLGFRWYNSASVGGNSEIHSVAIDDIVLSYNTSTITPSEDPSSSSLRTVKSTKNYVEVTPVRNIEFTVYPNPNSGQFTIDFAGIENNHEVQIILSDLQTGKQLYTTTFFSSTIEHNKIDVNPTEKIAPGRYSCSLICEGIRLTKQVVIN